MRFCPFAQRVHLVMDAKDIPHHSIFVNLHQKPEFLFEHSPNGTVPAVHVPSEGNGSLYESLVIADYLDEKFPQRRLYPQSPFAKAKDQLVIKKFEGVIGAMYKVFVSDKPEADLIVDIADKLDHFETELTKRGSTYFGGDLPGMVDYMIWPWCERADMLGYLIGHSYQLDEERFPALVSVKHNLLDTSLLPIIWRLLEFDCQYYTGLGREDSCNCRCYTVRHYSKTFERSYRISRRV